ncbi:hypothetical protein IAQ61_005745 [Plenodomus lingam]|nr:hypothetical protein IAQ61_005745 [Plenodomus lingam]
MVLIRLIALRLITSLAYLHSAHAHVTLNRQCWHDYPLLTVQLSCHLNGIHEMAHPVQTWPKEQEENFPWSHTPICTPSLPSLNSPLCVYTSTTFASGRGLSIFTTPNLANHFASLPVFHNASILAEQDINGDTGTWRTETIPGKGIGMVASHTLDFGDRVTSYTPAFLAVLEDELGTLNREKWWRIAISQLPDGKDGEESVKDKFMGLATVYGDERVKVQDIVKANTFQLEVQGINHLAVWPETSRLNHDCGPNAQYVIDPTTLTHHVHATRAIPRGHEITIAYTSPFDSTADRQSHLSSFGFTCSCARCTSDPSFSSTTHSSSDRNSNSNPPPNSDPTLSLIHTLQSHLNDYTPSSPATPSMAEHLLRLHHEQGLEGFMDMAYGFAALTYSSFGEESKAREYAARAKRAIEMKDGVWSANWRVWEAVRREGVKGHWSWRRRVEG